MKRRNTCNYNLRKRQRTDVSFEVDSTSSSSSDEEYIYDKEDIEEEVDNDFEEDVDEEEDEEVDEDEEYEDEEYDNLVNKGVKWVDKLKSDDPEAYSTWLKVNDEIDRTEPTILKILKKKMSIKDMTKLVQLFEVYQLSQIEPDENTISLRNRINKLMEQYSLDYEYLQSFSDDIRTKLEFMDNEMKSQNTHSMYRYKILNLDTNKNNKEAIYKKFSEMVDAINDTDEYFKIKRWLDCALSLPFDKIKVIDNSNIQNILVKARTKLDSELYGMDNVKEQILLYLNNRIYNPTCKSSLGLIGPPGVGKCFAKDTPIMMYNGEIKLVQDIQINDCLMGDDSTPRTVLSLARGMEKMYKIKQRRGIDYTVNESHILTLFSKKENKLVDIELRDYLKLDNKINLLGVKTGIDFKNTNSEFRIDPYLLGYILGIGLDGRVKFNFEGCSNIEKYILDIIELSPVDVSKKIYKVVKWNKPIHKYRRIPSEYLRSSLETRTFIMLGMLDASIIEIENNFKIPTFSKGFTSDCVYLARSLGLDVKTEIYNKTRVKGSFLRVIDINLTGYENLLSPDTSNKPLLNTYPIEVEELDVDVYYGFTITGNSRFLLEDFTIVHNTKIARILADVLDYPFEQISFGGVSGPEFIRGHDYTYIGSKPGMIVESMKRMGCKNGVLFLDEIDKASDNRDVSAALLHITDPIQNHEFRDRYLSELTIDLSKLWFIYSMNYYPSDIALKDRLHIIEVSGYSNKDKIIICKKYLIPKALDNLHLRHDSIIATDNSLSYLVNRVCSPSDKGVRTIEKIINDICSKIHFLVCNSSNIDLLGNISFKIPNINSYPVELTTNVIDILTKTNETDYVLRTMYN